MRMKPQKANDGLLQLVADRFRDAARERWEGEGSIEFDYVAPISCGDPKRGAYVQAWIWVAAEDAGVDT